MAQVTKAVSESLDRIKKNVSTAYTYFEPNYKRFRDFRTFVFKESINEQQKTTLQQMNRPVVEFNILEAYISRLLGEFSMHEPSIEVSPAEGVPIDMGVINTVEGHIRHILHAANKDSFSYNIYKDLLSGGFSVAKVWTDYAGPMSFNQEICLSRAFDPTMCGFDPMARAPHKADGKYSFEIYPMLQEEFEEDYPNINVNNLGYVRDVEGFNWSFRDSQSRKILLITDYYEKKKKRVKIVRLANGRVMTEKNYQKLEVYWQEQQFIEQIPVVVGKPRMTDLEIVCRYKFIEDQVLEYYETDYCYLPHVFVDGNSIILTQGTANTTYQMTRPYVYHAKGIQDLKNFAGQSLANYLENMRSNTFLIMKEAIPQEQDYIDLWTDPQRSGLLVANAFLENNPDNPIPTPVREIQNMPAPPEVMNTFQVTDPTTQTILGSFASNLGKNDNDLSGKAVIESATVGNSAAMPYVVGYLASLTQIGNIICDLMPKYILGERTISIVDKAKEKGYQEVNTPGNPVLNYDEKALKVNIDAGVNFQVQKSQAMQQIVGLMQASPEFSAFMNSDEGLPILVDNLTVYGADRLKEAVPVWMQKKQQMQQQQMQMQQQAMQQNPQMIRAQADAQKVKLQEQELMQDAQQQQFDNQIQIAKLANEKILADSKLMESEAKISQAQIDSAVRLEESETSLHVHALEAASKMAEIKSREHDRAIKSHESHLAQQKLEHELNVSDKLLKEKSND